MVELFTKSWKGEASLAKSFWLVYILGSFFIGLLVSMTLAIFVEDFQYKLQEDYQWYRYLVATMTLPYSLFSTICVWACARNSWIVWSIAARLYTGLSLFVAILGAIRLIYDFL